MTKPIDTFEIDEDTRIAVYHDYDSIPLDEIMSDYAGVQTLGIARGYSDISTDDEVRQAVERFTNSFHYYSHTNYQELRDRAIGLWLTANGYVYEFASLRGYSQGEWADVVIYAESDNAQYLEYRKQDLENWFRGDVYVLRLEKKKVYTADDGDTIEQWEQEEACGGILASDRKELEAIGRECLI